MDAVQYGRHSSALRPADNIALIDDVLPHTLPVIDGEQSPQLISDVGHTVHPGLRPGVPVTDGVVPTSDYA